MGRERHFSQRDQCGRVFISQSALSFERQGVSEGILTRFTQACAAGRGSGPSQSRNCAVLWHQRSATFKRYIKQQREEGHVQPKAIPGRLPSIRAQVEVGVLPQLQVYDDATLEQHCAMREQSHGERVSRWTMSRAIVSACARDPGDVLRNRSSRNSEEYAQSSTSLLATGQVRAG